MRTLGDNIRTRRKALGMTQTELAKKCGLYDASSCRKEKYSVQILLPRPEKKSPNHTENRIIRGFFGGYGYNKMNLFFPKKHYFSIRLSPLLSPLIITNSLL